MSEAQNIQWYPGHMAKARRKLIESVSLVDAVIEIADARIPASSRNPELSQIIDKKPLLLLLNKSDMADPNATTQWLNRYKAEGVNALAVDCRSGKGLSALKPAVNTLLRERIDYYNSKGMTGKALRLMIIGIPNAGKSSFINRMAKGGRAKVEDRPGVTRSNQWFPVGDGLELLDTPGVLWPKIENAETGEKLAMTGAVRDEILDVEFLAVRLLELLSKRYMPLLTERYGIEIDEPYEMLCAIGKRRGMMVRGGETDTERAAHMLLDEFRSCKIGRITLEV